MITSARKALAEELRGGRHKLRNLRGKITETKELLADLTASPKSYPAIEGPFPDIPLFPTFEPHTEGEGIPELSGVYFLWAAGNIEYVGKSRRLNQRLRLGGHHILRKDHCITFLIICPEALTWAECYYIGIAKPPLNFGGAS